MQSLEIFLVPILVSGFVSLVYNLIRDRNRQILDFKRDEKLNELQKQLSVYTTTFATQHTRFFNDKVDTLKSLHAKMSEFSANAKTYLLFFQLPIGEMSGNTVTSFWESVERTRKKVEENIQSAGKLISDVKLHVDDETNEVFSNFFLELSKLYGILALGTRKDNNAKQKLAVEDATRIMFGTLPKIEDQFNKKIRSFFQENNHT